LAVQVHLAAALQVVLTHHRVTWQNLRQNQTLTESVITQHWIAI
jgi:hypothetical protein